MPPTKSVGLTTFDEEKFDGVTIASNPAVSPTTRSVVGGMSKRVFDVGFALTALLMLAPLFILVACGVKAASSGPILYGHQRVGHGKRSFRCWKFRSMVTDGDAVLARYLEDNPEERVEWIRNRKLRNDPRVTRIGAVLRACSVDELPQIINVLLGDMSIVGPRPVVQDELDMYGAAAVHYLRCRPGITGLWQVSGRSDTSYDQRIRLDTRYTQNWSMATDVFIIVRTIPVVLSTKGSC